MALSLRPHANRRTVDLLRKSAQAALARTFTRTSWFTHLFFSMGLHIDPGAYLVLPKAIHSRSLDFRSTYRGISLYRFGYRTFRQHLHSRLESYWCV